MDAIENITQINYLTTCLSVLSILLAFKFLTITFDWFVERFGIETKQMRKRREDHKLLINTSQNVIALQEKGEKDNNGLRDCLTSFIEETRKENQELRAEMRTLAVGHQNRDKQIEALMCGSKELLGDTIDKRYDKYIRLKGIPQNEVDEFNDIYLAYARLNGNHGRETKYQYVKQNLPVIPVETKLLIDDEENDLHSFT